jgi:predicted esterase
VLFLDAGGRGSLPVKKYQQLAETYGLILAGSFNARNGPFERSGKAAYAVLKDITSRYSVDPSAVILAGFSGGARVATQIGLEDPIIAGVVACGAFPIIRGTEKNRKLLYSGVVGRGDLNYLEAIEAYTQLDAIKKEAYLTFFSGDHDWPPPDAFEMSVMWVLMRLEILSKNAFGTWSQMNWKGFQQSLDSAFSFEIDRQRQQVTRWLPDYQQKADSLENQASQSKVFLKRRASFSQAIQQEKKWRQDFLQNYQQQVAFGAPDSAFHSTVWSAAGKQLKEFSHSKDPSELWMGRRLQSFTQVLLWEGFSNFMSYKQYRQAAAAGKMVSLLQAESPFGSIMAARAYARLNQREETLRYLEQAIRRGYSRDQLKCESLFEPFLKEKRIVKLLEQIE